MLKVEFFTNYSAMSDHPSVRNSHSAGAIGVMGVKKTVNGVWLHFAHNTDSFVSHMETFASERGLNK